MTTFKIGDRVNNRLDSDYLVDLASEAGVDPSSLDPRGTESGSIVELKAAGEPECFDDDGMPVPGLPHPYAMVLWDDEKHPVAEDLDRLIAE